MSGEDRQQFARDAHARMLRHEQAASSLRQRGRKKAARHEDRLAEHSRLQRDRYDDAGEFQPIDTERTQP